MDGIPNAHGVESVDNSNVIESAPAWTSETPQRETRQTAEEVETVEEAAPNAEASAETTTETTTEETVTPAAPEPRYTPEQIQQLAQAADYQPQEVEANFFDELGNFDQAKFAEFMAANNQNIFNQAVQAANARTQLTELEASSWASIHENFPEVAGNDTLTKALRGARIQDLLAGGDGDLTRLATDIVGPIRDNRIKAVEDANRQITEQKKLETFTPDTAAPERAEPSLMQQLQEAVSKGDSAKANSIRHAIRKERINANN